MRARLGKRRTGILPVSIIFPSAVKNKEYENLKWKNRPVAKKIREGGGAAQSIINQQIKVNHSDIL